MAGALPLIGIAIAVVLIVFLAVFIWKLKKDRWQRTINYRQYFMIGIVWLILGVIMIILYRDTSTIGYFFTIMGIVSLAIGLKNRDKWGKPQKVTATQSKIIATLVTAGILLLALGLMVFMLLTK